MPSATDLSVNNGAASPVSKTFTLLTPSSGYGSIAEWALKEGDISSVFPRLTALARPSNGSSAKGSAKVLQLKFKLPSSYTDSVTGLTQVSSGFEFNGTVTVPDDFPEGLKSDAVAFTVNLLNTSLLKAMIKDGLPAT